MRIKRFVAFLLVCLLLAGTACAEAGLKPRRDIGESSMQSDTMPTEESAHSGEHEEDFSFSPSEEEKQPSADDATENPAEDDGAPLYQERIEGTLVLEESDYGYSNSVTYDLFIAVSEYEDYSVLIEAGAMPAAGEGMAVEAALNLESGLEQMEELASGELTVTDAASGDVYARYTLSLDDESNITIRDALSGDVLEFGSPDDETLLDAMAIESIYRGSEALYANYEPLARRFAALDNVGDALTLNLRELTLPLFRTLYSPAMDEAAATFGMNFGDIAIISEALLENVRGEITLTVTGNDSAQFVYYSEGSPELSMYKAEGELGVQCVRGLLYERQMGQYAAIARAEVDFSDGLLLRVEDYESGGFLYADVYEDTTYAGYSFNAALSAGDGYGDASHLLLSYETRDIDVDFFEVVLTLRLAEGSSASTCTLTLNIPQA